MLPTNQRTTDKIRNSIWRHARHSAPPKFLLLGWCVVASLLVLPARLHAAEAVLIGAGDIAKCGGTLQGAEATAKLLDRFFDSETAGPEAAKVESAIFTLGDNAYPKGSTREFANCYDPTWGRHKVRTHPSVGNHEYKTRNARPYFDYFGSAAGDRDKGYYSYNLGDWHIVVINSVCVSVGGCGPGSPQHTWLLQDLKKNPSRCTLAYMHHPLFSSGKHGAEPQIRPLVQALFEADAELIIAGHEHNYERFAPQTPLGLPDAERGIRQIIAGTGGREHRKLRKPANNSEMRDTTSFGLLKLSLHPDSYEWEFIPVEGATFHDLGGGNCH